MQKSGIVGVLLSSCWRKQHLVSEEEVWLVTVVWHVSINTSNSICLTLSRGHNKIMPSFSHHFLSALFRCPCKEPLATVSIFRTFIIGCTKHRNTYSTFWHRLLPNWMCWSETFIPAERLGSMSLFLCMMAWSVALGQTVIRLAPRLQKGTTLTPF